MAFEKLKEALTNDVVLAHPDMSKPLVIFTDASNYGVGAVLVQDGRPVWFASRSLNPLERKYDTREKEAIGIRFGLEKFKPYFYPNQVTVFNDHGNLRWLMSQRQTGRIARWQLDLQQYDYAYIKGTSNLVADCLSKDIDNQVKLMKMTRLRAKKENQNKTKAPTERSSKMVAVQTQVVTETKETLAEYFKNIDKKSEQRRDTNLRGMMRNSKEFALKNGVLYKKKQDTHKLRLVIPEHLINDILKRMQGIY